MNNVISRDLVMQLVRSYSGVVLSCHVIVSWCHVILSCYRVVSCYLTS